MVHSRRSMRHARRSVRHARLLVAHARPARTSSSQCLVLSQNPARRVPRQATSLAAPGENPCLPGTLPGNLAGCSRLLAGNLVGRPGRDPVLTGKIIGQAPHLKETVPASLAELRALGLQLAVEAVCRIGKLLLSSLQGHAGAWAREQEQGKSTTGFGRVYRCGDGVCVWGGGLDTPQQMLYFEKEQQKKTTATERGELRRGLVSHEPFLLVLALSRPRKTCYLADASSEPSHWGTDRR
eukprot:350159-Chlamydomonas_euryale.AAC.2